MLIQLLRFECFYQGKRLAFWLFCLLFTFFGFLVGSQNFAPANVNFNSVYQISFNTGISTLGVLFSVIFYTVSGVLRDRLYLMDQIVFSTSLSKTNYFISRFVGVFFSTLLSFSPFLLGFVLGTLSPALDQDRLSAFDAIIYLRTWLIFIVPNAFICSSVVFTVGTLTRNTVATYVSGVFLYVLYILGSIYLNSPVMANAVPGSAEGLRMAAYCDPFGMSAFFEQTQFWTPTQKNYQLVSLSGYLLHNRLLWTSVCLVVLLFTYQLFSFRLVSTKPKKLLLENPTSNKQEYSPTAISQSLRSEWMAFCSILKLEFRSMIFSLPFLGVISCWLVMVFTEIYSRLIEGGPYRDSWYPSTNLLIELFTESLPVFSLLLIVFYSGELVWRDRTRRFHGIIDSTPVSNLVLFLTKLTLTATLPIVLIGLAMAISLTFQLVLGYSRFEWLLYLSVFYYHGLGLFFYCVFVVFVQSVVSNKFLGMALAALLILLLGTNLSVYIGVEHPMIKLGYLPIPGYTNMSGYTNSSAFHHFAAYWYSFGGILLILAYKLWPRGENRPSLLRFRPFVMNWSMWQRTSMAALLLVILLSGTVIYYNMHVDGNYNSKSGRLDIREAYERSYKKYEKLGALSYIDLKTQVDLFPDRNGYELSATYILENKGTKPVELVLLTERASLDSVGIVGARLIEVNEELGTYLFSFDEPLAPKQQVSFSYQVDGQTKGYEVNPVVPENGTYLRFNEFEPRLRYSTSREISDPYERRLRGLPERPPSVPDIHLENLELGMGKTFFETVVSTDANQHAIAPGQLKRTWLDGDRRYFHYQANQKIVPFIAYFSAAYSKLISNYGNISIEQFYHPGHEYNLDRIETSVKRTLDYCISNFGPYPFDHIKVAEIPGHWGFGGVAHPGTIAMVEDNLYLIDVSDSANFDLVAKRTIHEVAHQWFGGVLSPSLSRGGSMLNEGLAKYTEAAVLEKIYGKKALWQIAETANNKYFHGRSYATKTEPPLYLTDDESYLSYGKSFTAMLALKDLIGEPKINKVVRSLIDRHKGESAFSLTSIEFLNELKKEVPEVHHELINDWFMRVVVYDLTLTAVSYTFKEGQFEISLDVSAARNAISADGQAASLSINEPIPIGLFMEHPSKLSNDQSIVYYGAHHIEKKDSQIKIRVDKLPHYVAIDPFATRSDKNLHDNTKSLRSDQ